LILEGTNSGEGVDNGVTDGILMELFLDVVKNGAEAMD